MANLKKRIFKFLILLILLIFVLNISLVLVPTTWLPKQLMQELSDLMNLLKPYNKVCSCARCIEERGISLWFDNRFNSSIPPLLTLSLQMEKNPSRYNDTIVKLFQVIPGDIDPLLQKRLGSCRRCAVVGNSGNLRDSWYGAQIDNHDFVFRMNKAPTAGFEDHVGSKTTHHFLYPESYRELGQNVSMILIPFKILDMEWVVSAITTGTITQTYMAVFRKIKVKSEKILVYHPAFIKYVYDNWLQGHGRYPSTGILAVIFALHVCDEVNLYGFGANSKGDWHHYWETNPSAGAFRKTGVHDGDFESNVTSILTSINKVRIFHGR
ncbi:CMP-N-acetylneuraminate-beta-galactosamide-alpha-2,3-sialyltransferase 1 isoform X2 [Sorex fumeus]|uniref:CMP-N-acetylneuraminate-beta-galactosamide- alpha-2,3-sialyltransferase 1 isoform X2 n=1 Tax=Sorex fumeus TaxID=62283 RepID=UPI0024ACEE56|nr:CMP-N-acetylneuraminate-beta-galactosamide-alpha-2,3-sialyltransferase 1 isoform X2 [Sorex fumeus]